MFSSRPQYLRYMGRVDFWDIYYDVKNLMRQKSGEYVLSSTPGWGKSYILAVLACLLLRQEKVIFIPDYGRFSESSFYQVKRSFVLAYVEDGEKLSQIQTLDGWEGLIAFVDHEHRMGIRHTYIVDGARAEGLDGVQGESRGGNMLNEGSIWNMDWPFVEILRRISHGQILIRSSNRPITIAHELRSNYTDGRFYFGGLSPVEMESWWRFCEVFQLLPNMLLFETTDGDVNDEETVALRRCELQILTGCNFHLLEAIVRFKPWADAQNIQHGYNTFLSYMVGFMNHDPFISARKGLGSIARKVKAINSNAIFRFRQCCALLEPVTKYPELTQECLEVLLDPRFFRLTRDDTVQASSGWVWDVLVNGGFDY
ncbi:hypothetical protein TWF730_009949 [Orbilia blumenaviensis]|uniref:Uncharacterized protein n=1 Tax=Orbilia blumenaviensis TaxID=1796055 RepID=A0AAV9UUP6_9PEZI